MVRQDELEMELGAAAHDKRVKKEKNTTPPAKSGSPSRVLPNPYGVMTRPWRKGGLSILTLLIWH
jgi:hypothetical protein